LQTSFARLHVQAAFICPFNPSAPHLDDLHKLVHARVAGEQRLPEQQLRADAPLAPNVNRRRVVRAPENKLRRAVVPAANIRHVGLSLNEGLGAAEVAQLELVVAGIEEEVLGLDVAVADAHGVDVAQGAAQLVHVEAHEEDGEGDLGLLVLSGDGVDCLGDEFEHQVEVLRDKERVRLCKCVNRGGRVCV